jgi:hypothetical protein
MSPGKRAPRKHDESDTDQDKFDPDKHIRLHIHSGAMAGIDAIGMMHRARRNSVNCFTSFQFPDPCFDVSHTR